MLELSLRYDEPGGIFYMTAGADSQPRLLHVRRVLIQVFFLNVGVAIAKMSVGYATNTLSMLADGFHSLLDSASNVVGLVGVTVAARPPDENHPYGHQKYETLTSMVIGALVLLTAVEIVKDAVYRLASHAQPHVTVINLAVMVVTMGVNITVSTYEARAARKHKSEILGADALQTRSDIVVSAGVILALFVIELGYPVFDGITALAVTGAILYSAWLIFHRATRVLSDSTALEPEEVESVAMSVKGVHSVEKIRSRGSENQLSVDLHIRVDPDISITEAHNITHRVRQAVEESTGAIDVVIHTEPEPQEQLH